MERLAVDAYASEQAAMDALRAAARSRATLLLAAEEAPAELLRRIAAEFPDQRFALIGASNPAPNIAAYTVRTAQGVWLAGAAAGLLSGARLVGYLANDETADLQPAFAAGLATTNPAARLIETRLERGAAPAAALKALATQGADVLYVDLPDLALAQAAAAAPPGVMLLCHNHGETAVPAPPLMAALQTDPGAAVFEAGRDLYDAMWKGGSVRRLGLENPEAVRLHIATAVPDEIHRTLEHYQQRLIAGTVVAPGDNTA